MNKEHLKKIDRHVGQKVRQARIFRGMSQEDLAVAIGLTFQQVQKYENGSNRLSASRIYQIAKILRLKPAYFFEGLPEYRDEDIAPFTIEHIRLIRYYDAAPKEVQKEFFKLIKSVVGP
ncbi:MAG: XRE family transcriptional regulator [Micavibrio aeruginosavorus]|uniref:XRE family transcriptional regulator n=1 Tax=Micavibrio aeruginosavorus TaxID=349221 RepID=A0A2W5A741_9BACT|nr:MAG: XRE family transcriptional regulator [Micavibrio aeruginosavorus]